MPRWPRWGVAHGLGWKLLILDRALGSLGPVARLGCLGRAYKGRAALCAGGQHAAVALAMIGLTKSSHALAARNQCASYPARDRSPSHSGQAYTVTSYPAPESVACRFKSSKVINVRCHRYPWSALKARHNFIGTRAK